MWKTRLIIAVALFLVVHAATLGTGLALRGALTRSQVTIIGAGSSPSILITAGDARLLLAGGSDATGFANGWRRWSGLAGVTRVDVLLLPGGGLDAAGSHALEHLSPRWAASIVPLAAAARPVVPPLTPPLGFELGQGISVTVERTARPTGSDQPPAWRMLITRGRTLVAVVPDGDAAAAFTWSDRVAALILLRGDVAGAVTAVRPAALVVAGEVRSGTLADDLPPVIQEPLWALRVPTGEVRRLAFVSGGLRLPEDTRTIDPSPTVSRRPAPPGFP